MGDASTTGKERERTVVCRRRGLPAALATLVLWLAGAAAVPAQQESSAAALQRDTPRAAVEGYLQAAREADYQRAAEYLNLRALPTSERARRGPVLARQLKVVLDRTLWIELEELSDDPNGKSDDGLPSHRDLVGSVDTTRGPVPILVERVPVESATPIWLVASTTVARIPALYEQFGYGRLGEYLPPVFFRIQVFEVQLWQWIGLLVLAFLAAVVAWLAAAVTTGVARRVTARAGWDVRLAAVAAGPLRLTLAVLLFSAGTYSLALAVPVLALLGAMEKALAIAAVTWFFVRIAALVAEAVTVRLTARGQTAATSVVPLGRRTVQVLVVALAALAVLQNFGINVTGLLAGLGIGGLAVALAAQKTVENLFGGVTLIADQPVRVGDFCRFGDRIGTVEEVGLRSTRVRTLDRTVVTVPNSEFSALQLENFSRRDRIWFHTTIGLRYETTPDQLRYVLVELKRLLVSHPRVHPEPARPRFVGFGAYSLDVEIFAYIQTSDFDDFLAVREDLLLRIMDLVAASGSGFAFPSQTIYAGADGGLDAERTKAAEASVEEWRHADALGVPYFRSDQLAGLADTLDYPPRGSATAAS